MNRSCRVRALDLIFSSGTWLLLLTPTVDAATQMPFSIPIRFGADKSIEFSVDVARHRYYQVDLTFPFKNQEQRPVAKELAGNATRICEALNDCGITASFQVTIRRGTDIVLREEKTPIGHYAFSANGFYRLIVKVPLRPAHYDITVEVVHSPLALANYDAFIQFTTDARSADLDY